MAASPSDTTAFGPDLGAISAFALGRSGVRRPAITADNLADAAMAANLVLVEWANDEPQLWQVQLTSVPLTQGVITYTLASNLLLLLDAYITVTVGGIPQDRVIYGVSRVSYDSYPNKTFQGYPTTYWFNRVIPPQISLYQAPDGNGPYVLNFHGVYQDQDAVMPGATGLDLPYRAFSAFTDAVAAKLSLSYKPEAFQVLEAVAMKSYAALRAQENESTPLFVTPGLSSYFR